jgi:antitoxin component YwqK of YwqJK toxin-antitoxin module
MKQAIFLFSLLVFSSCKDKGLVETFYENGDKNEIYHINGVDSLKEGKFEKWYEGGKLYEESNYVRGKLEGPRTIYYETGETEIVENYKAGILEGDYTAYYKNGTIKVYSKYVNNVLTGEFLKYYPSGQINEKVMMENNMENGPFEEYYENGKLKWKGTFKNGDNEFGLLENYDSTGVLVKKMMCDSLRICRTIWENGVEVELKEN